MKKMTIYTTILLFVLFSLVTTKNVYAAERTVVYFKETTCIVCQELVGYGRSGNYCWSSWYLK